MIKAIGFDYGGVFETWAFPIISGLSELLEVSESDLKK
jgi:hypothetical protein